MIALCSTSYPQTKHIINKAFEASSEDISNVGFSLLFQAIVREDSQYLNEDVDGEDGGEDADEIDDQNLEEEASQEEIDEESSEEKPKNHKSKAKVEEEGGLGKRKAQNGVPANTPDKLTSKPTKNKVQQLQKGSQAS